eukprot:EG_transcript_13030
MPLNPKVKLYLQLAGVACAGYGGYTGFVEWQRRKELGRMYQYTSQELLQLGEKVVRDFQEKGYTQIPISYIMAMRVRDSYWSFRHFLEFSPERHNLTETVYDRLCCYHLEPPKDDTAPADYEPWHFDGGPGPKPTPKFERQMRLVHHDLTFVGDKVMSALAANLQDKTLAAIAIDNSKRSECIWKFYPEETPARPANCGQHGLFYILPSTTMMDSPLCRKTFEIYDRQRKKYIDLEEDAPDIVCVTVVPSIPLLKYVKQFKPGAWRVVADRQFTHDGRKTIEYAYATHTSVKPRFELTKDEAKYFGVQDGFKRKRELGQ